MDSEVRVKTSAKSRWPRSSVLDGAAGSAMRSRFYDLELDYELEFYEDNVRLLEKQGAVFRPPHSLFTPKNNERRMESHRMTRSGSEPKLARLYLPGFKRDEAQTVALSLVDDFKAEELNLFYAPFQRLFVFDEIGDLYEWSELENGHELRYRGPMAETLTELRATVTAAYDMNNLLEFRYDPGKPGHGSELIHTRIGEVVEITQEWFRVRQGADLFKNKVYKTYRFDRLRKAVVRADIPEYSRSRLDNEQVITLMPGSRALAVDVSSKGYEPGPSPVKRLGTWRFAKPAYVTAIEEELKLSGLLKPDGLTRARV